MVIHAGLRQGSGPNRDSERNIRMDEMGGPYGYCPVVFMGQETYRRTRRGNSEGRGRKGTFHGSGTGNRGGDRRQEYPYSGPSRGRRRLSTGPTSRRRTTSRNGTGQRAKLRRTSNACGSLPRIVGKTGDTFMKTVGEWIMSFIRRPDPVEDYNPEQDSFVQDLHNEVKFTQKIYARRESPEAWRARNSFERELLGGRNHHALDRN